MTPKLKVYELAKELSQDSQHLVDVIQRLGIDIKNSMSVLGSEEVRTVRDYYKKLKPMAKASEPKMGKAPMTEKRVGSTVIRRRSPSATAKPAEKAEPQQTDQSAASSQPVEVEPQSEMLEEEAVNERAASSAAEFASEAEDTVAVIQVESELEGVEEEMGASQKLEATSACELSPAAASKAVLTSSKGMEAPRVPRRIYPSIIKKVATEQYLGEKVGPKVEKRERPIRPVAVGTAAKAKVGVVGAPAKPAGTGTATGTGLLGPKRVKEVEVTPAADAAKEAGKRRLLEGQSAIFKRADYLKRELVHATKKRKNVISRPAMKTQITKPAEHKRVVEMIDSISVADLAKEMGVKVTAVIAKLMGMGVTATINQSIDYDTATLAAHEFGYEVKQKIFKEEDFVPAVDLSAEKLMPRPPVVTIMGHVDHGKTSLLDAIRKTNVAGGEAGGITQHIGAYTVETPKGKISFIDTPGHEAFTAMRARGAKVTDIVILVVSAVDGVMPQTLESISHAQAAKVPIIVAVNKIDLPDANPDRIKQTLAGHGLSPEEWGGDTIYVNVSAKTGKGIDQLLESILLQAELLELKANYATPARGTIVESRLDKNRGPIATILVQHGKLVPGDLVVCGAAFGKVRAMGNSFGKKVLEAGPSEPVEILGLPEVPNAGDEIYVVQDDRKARELADARLELAQQREGLEARPKLSLADMMATATGGDKEVRVLLRADVQGSAEALREAMTKFPAEKVKLKLLHVGSGGISESDVMLASASRAVILGFNIRPDVRVQKLADTEGVELRTYNIIYDLLEDVKRLLEGQLDKVVKEKVIGRAEVRDVFHIPKVGTIAGSAVVDGKVIRGCFLRLLRDSRVVYEGKISSLRRFKEDVKEVAQGYECGIGLENFNDLKTGDQFEAYLKEESAATL